jgi:hypothetical protein
LVPVLTLSSQLCGRGNSDKLVLGGDTFGEHVRHRRGDEGRLRAARGKRVGEREASHRVAAAD